MSRVRVAQLGALAILAALGASVSSACAANVVDDERAATVRSSMIPADSRARTMVLLDTSESMLHDFSTETNVGGDGDDTALFCDNAIGTGFSCSANLSCTLENGALELFRATDPLVNPSRMLAAKATLHEVVDNYEGLVDFGLMRYAGEDCVHPDYCCETQVDDSTPGRCFSSGDNGYPDFLWPRRCNVDWVCPAGCGADGICQCSADDDCPEGFGCDAGHCMTADEARAKSFPCARDRDCWAIAQVCGDNGLCHCDADRDCPNGYTCETDGSGSFCEALPLDNLTYQGGCGDSSGGGRVLEQPTDGSNERVKEWIDFVEDFCSSSDEVGGRPRNPELRADGRTPLAPAIQAAHDSWYEPILDEASDPLVDCRPYSLVVITDGMDTCSTSDPSTEIERLFSANQENPVRTYVIGIGSVDRCNDDDDCVTTCNTSLGVCNCTRDIHCTGTCNAAAGHVCSSLNLQELNEMSVAGGTGPEALLATTPEDVEEALADIMSDATSEACNGVDDNCNGLIDESGRVYQTCYENAECPSSNCDAGRCRCTVGSIDECAGGFLCAQDGFCRPTCSAGRGPCARAGVHKCGAPTGKCCVDDGLDDCVVLEPLPGTDDACEQSAHECEDGEASCAPGYNCVAGQCAALCAAGEFPCPNGTECRDGHCLGTPASLVAEAADDPEGTDEWTNSTLPSPPPDGCGCRLGSPKSHDSWTWLLSAILGGLLARRRRRY